MASKTEIFNGALLKLGSTPITDADDDSKKTTATLNVRYQQVRRNLLVLHPWNFSIRREKLDKLTTTPAFGFVNEFSLPAGSLRILATKAQLDAYNVSSIASFNVLLASENFQKADTWKVEGTKFLNDSDDVSVLFIFDEKVEANFSPQFSESLSALLAAETAFKITGNRSLTKDLKKEFFEVILPESQRTDGQEGTLESIQVSSWISARS